MPDSPSIPARTGDAPIMKQGHTTDNSHGTNVLAKRTKPVTDLSVSTTGRKS